MATESEVTISARRTVREPSCASKRRLQREDFDGECSALALLVERSEYRAVNEMAGDDRERRIAAVVQTKKSGRLNPAGRARTLLLARHPWVQARQQRQNCGEHEEGVDEADRRSQPPGRPFPALERRRIQPG